MFVRVAYTVYRRCRGEETFGVSAAPFTPLVAKRKGLLNHAQRPLTPQGEENIQAKYSTLQIKEIRIELQGAQ